MLFRIASGALGLVVGLSLSACGDDEPKAATPSPTPTASPAAPSVQIDVSLFRPRVQREALDVRCPGGGEATAGGWFDRGPQNQPPKARSADRETDGVVAVANEYAGRQPNQPNRGWDELNPPTPKYLFPREPATATRAVVQFVAASRIVAVLVLDRDKPGYDWHVGRALTCGVL